jgi:hypothetical protein
VAEELASRNHHPHLFSTNSQRADSEDLPEVGYVNRHHNPGAVDLLSGKPTGVNEYNNTASNADRYTREVWTAFTKGTFFHYWRGQDSDTEVAHTLQRLGVFQDFVAGTSFGSFSAEPLGPKYVGRPEHEFVGFVRQGGDIVIDLGPVERTFPYAWINPRTGVPGPSGEVTGSGTHTFSAPTGDMWGLHVGGPGPCTPPQEAPTLLAPIGTVGDPRPTFSWTAIDGADTYTIFARTVAGEVTVVPSTVVTGTSFTPAAALPTDQLIEWKVKAERPCGIGPYSAYVTFTISNTPATLSIGDASVAEGHWGTTALVFPLALSRVAASDVSVDVVTAGGTATAGVDYHALSVRATIPAGQTQGTVAVSVIGDVIDEDDETVIAHLANAAGATIGDGAGVGTMLDDDATPTLSIGSVSLPEGDWGSSNAVFTLTLSAASGREVRVAYRTADGTAVAPGDYEASEGERVFQPGEVTRTITVAVVGDETAEANETFFVDLLNPVNATVAVARGTGTIVNDESPWKHVGTGDFNGDGKLDILWRHDLSGELGVWFMNGIVRIGGAFTTPSGIADLGWRVRGTGDFNADGKVDILWRHEGSGQVVVWFMNGTVRTGATFTDPPAIADLGWRIRGTGDFNGDGRVDILWRHEGSGQLVVWEMSGTTLVRAAFVDPETAGDLYWIPSGTGDFNRDGKVDILWRHRVSGEVAVWLMDGTKRDSGTFTTPSSVADLAWKLVGAADLSGDGKVDILWRHNASGQNVAWIMDGVVLLPGGGVFLDPVF